MEILKDSNAYAVFKNFAKISQIPRCSNDEEEISQFIYDFGLSLGLETSRDEYGNVLIIKPASKGYESHDSLVLQAHLDMVCEKTEDSLHDFSCDPIELQVEGDIIKAKDTTLGADDGAGVALMMAILEDNRLDHPRLECLFTTTEETGMDGAIGLSENLLTGKNLINLDNEEDWVIIVGCAGGINAYLDLNFKRERIDGLKNYQVKVSGLKGGHSGMMIDEPLLNAIKLLSSLLLKLKAELSFKLQDINGGSKHNAIPSSAYAVIGVEEDEEDSLKDEFLKISEELKSQYIKRELDLEFTLEQVDSHSDYIDPDASQRILRLISTHPHGVNTYDKELDIVRSSNNLAIVKSDEESFSLQTSIRSSDEKDMKALKDEISSLAGKDGFKITFSEGYPMWEPDFDNELLEKAKNVYNELRNEDVEVLVIHAGLETGILSQKYPDMNMIAIGPNISGAHTPNEKISIKSVEFIYQYLKSLIKNL